MLDNLKKFIIFALVMVICVGIVNYCIYHTTCYLDLTFYEMSGKVREVGRMELYGIQIDDYGNTGKLEITDKECIRNTIDFLNEIELLYVGSGDSYTSDGNGCTIEFFDNSNLCIGILSFNEKNQVRSPINVKIYTPKDRTFSLLQGLYKLKLYKYKEDKR